MNDARTNPEFDALFDECLRDVLRGSRSIDDCAAAYPHYADDLRPALQAGILTARLKAPQMSAASVDLLEMRLRAQMQMQASSISEEKVIRPARWLPLSRAAAIFLIVFLASLGSGAGAVAASANAVPGDWLYGLKRLWEAIVLALTPLTGEADDLYLTIAERRLDEVEQLSQRGMLTDAALLDLYGATAQAITRADAQTAVEVTRFLSEMHTQIDAASTLNSGLRHDLLSVTTPLPLSDGRLQAPSITPPSLLVSTTAPTFTPSLTATSTVTPTATPSVTPTISPTPSATLTPTPRVPATATRTPTPSVTPTASVTPSITPSHTWTPLPLPTLPPQTPLTQATEQPGQNTGGNNGSSTTPDEQATVRVRETEQSVYLTQTAGPPPTEITP